MADNENDAFVFYEEKQDDKLEVKQGVDSSIVSSKARRINKQNSELAPWKVLIADDDEAVHEITKMVLGGYVFQNRALQLFSAYSGQEAIEFLAQEDDVALVLLDVVMESDDAGLICVKKIREQLKNDSIRIILRTGQPGQAPEKDIVINYDINDYKSKADLTAQKLFTAITASLRAYQHINTITRSKQGLEKIIDASRVTFEIESFNLFSSCVLEQMNSFLHRSSSSLFLYQKEVDDSNGGKLQSFIIQAATGGFAGKEGMSVGNVVSKDALDCLRNSLKWKENIFTDHNYTCFIETTRGEQCLIYQEWEKELSEMELDLVSIFAANIAVAFKNISLNKEVRATQTEMILTLSQLVEGRSKETANHIRRVAAVSGMLASGLGLDEHEIAMIELGAPMHDIGKIGTPDYILKKPGKLTPEEYEIMKEHALYGSAMFENSNRDMMVTAGIIAAQHHEKWDGTGYPKGLKGEGIHLYGRIVALADVVDALAYARCYKDAWGLDAIVETLKEERGRHFDPNLVDLFLGSLDEYKELLKKYP